LEIVKIHKIDNFFDNPDEIREFALKMDFDEPLPIHGWHGIRATPKDRIVAGVDLEKMISEEVSFRIPNFTYDEMDLYFHITPEEVRNHFDTETFEEASKHYDSNDSRIVGLVYLTPNPPKNSGTSFFDDSGNKVGEAENVYNRMVMYPADILHGPTNPFGDTKENGRLTLVFFLKKYEKQNTRQPTQHPFQ
jgi:hypothetical protein